MFTAIIDKLPPGPTMFFGMIYVVMPILPEPHLVQKAMMVSNGVPLAPIDIFDVFAHSAGGLLALAVFLRQRKLTAEAAANRGQNGDHNDNGDDAEKSDSV